MKCKLYDIKEHLDNLGWYSSLTGYISTPDCICKKNGIEWFLYHETEHLIKYENLLKIWNNISNISEEIFEKTNHEIYNKLTIEKCDISSWDFTKLKNLKYISFIDSDIKKIPEFDQNIQSIRFINYNESLFNNSPVLSIDESVELFNKYKKLKNIQIQWINSPEDIKKVSLDDIKFKYYEGGFLCYKEDDICFPFTDIFRIYTSIENRIKDCDDNIKDIIKTLKTHF